MIFIGYENILMTCHIMNMKVHNLEIGAWKTNTVLYKYHVFEINKFLICNDKVD